MSFENEEKHTTLKLVVPEFNSRLTDLIIDLDYLRMQTKLECETPERIFNQFHQVMFMVESVASARIEGNHTTILEFINSKIVESGHRTYGIQEINNLEHALQFVEQYAKTYPINRMFVSELHKIVMDGLPIEAEGDYTPGAYRRENVAIAKAEHQPPDSIQVEDYMDELFRFINMEVERRNELLKTAIAHHRFVWIHPFTNGNGRVARLLTYAMLVKYGFSIDTGRILNPAAVFCSTRQEYYKYLAHADKSVLTGNDDGMLQWCEYVLSGLKKETDNIYRLTDYTFVKNKLLIPTLKHGVEHEILTSSEYQLLEKALKKQPFQASDVKDAFSGKNSSSVAAITSRIIKNLRNKKILVPNKEKGREYYLQIANSPLLRGLVQAMSEADLLPIDPNS